MPTRSEFVDILLDIAAEEHGLIEPRLEALDLASDWINCGVCSVRYPNVFELVGALLVRHATDTSASAKERMHAARLISKYGYVL